MTMKKVILRRVESPRTRKGLTHPLFVVEQSWARLG
jgi:hypothetical protein